MKLNVLAAAMAATATLLMAPDIGAHPDTDRGVLTAEIVRKPVEPDIGDCGSAIRVGISASSLCPANTAHHGQRRFGGRLAPTA